MAAIVASSSQAIVSKTLDGIVTSWNQAAERTFGYTKEEMIGASIRRIIPPERQAEEDDILARLSKGEQIANYETVRICKDGSRIDISVSISPVLDEAGTIIGASKIAHDITEQKRNQERERLLMREVNHRSKNMLALVQSIAHQTAVRSPDEFVERFTQRVQALSANQDVLVQNSWCDVPIAVLVRAQLAHFADLIGRRILVSGPPLKITAAAAQALGLSIHELATNAAKYGALSNSCGVVRVSWRISGNGREPRFVMSWKETGGPPVSPPRRTGFGSTVTGTLVRMSVDGEVQTDYAAGGLTWKLSCLASKVVERERAAGHSEAAYNKVDSAQPGRRILVVEDEPLIAVEVASMLVQAGYEVLGPVGSVAQALAIIDRCGCDAAVLDVNLGSETAEPIARRLSRSGITFVTISGYSKEQLPPSLGPAVHLGKPLNTIDLINSLKQCLSDSDQSYYRR